MSWQFALLLFFIFAVINTLWSRVFAQKSKLPGKVPMALGYLLGVLPLGVLVGLAGRDVHIAWSFKTISLLILEGSFIGLFNWLAFVAWKKTSVAQFQTVFQLYAVVAALFGWVLLGEGLTGWQIFGSILLLVGAVIAANARKVSKKSKNVSLPPTGVLLVVAAATALGIGLVAEKAALNQMSVGAYFIFGFGTQTVALCLIAIKDLVKLNRSTLTRYELKGALICGVLSVMVGFFYIYAIRHAQNISLVSLVSTFQVPLSVAAGYFILHERDDILMLTVACVIAFGGLLLMLR